jgi:C4-dicarboxylate-specific signal transduction histidine kinase
LATDIVDRFGDDRFQIVTDADEARKASPLASYSLYRGRNSDFVRKAQASCPLIGAIQRRVPSSRLEDEPMAIETHVTGIDVLGDMAVWGAHFCLFYETKEDLLDTVIPYCKAGLESEEYCLWIVDEPLTIEEATDVLRDAVPDLDRYLVDSRVEVVSARDWFLQNGRFDGQRVTTACYEKLARVSARGYPGMRVTGDTTWLEKRDWRHFCNYDDGLNEVIGNQRFAALCTYPLAACGTPEILDVVRTHQFAIARRHGRWEVIETAGLKRAKAELTRLNAELEQRVAERTSQLMQASEALHEAQMKLAHFNRVTTMGQLAASIAHEIRQPLAVIAGSALAASRWLGTQPPNLDEAQAALGLIGEAGHRANEFVDRIRNLIKKAPPQKDSLEINEAIREVIALTHGELEKNRVLLQTQLAEDLPVIQGDRVQLEQVILNLVINAVEAMSGVSAGSRQLLIRTGKDASGGVLVVVQDSGPGVSPESFDRLFDAFYTTKPSGMGMGLSICRSIIEAHDGRLWAVPHEGPGATFQFTLPIDGEDDR